MSKLLEMEIDDSFNNKLIKFDRNNPYHEAKKKYLEIQRAKDLGSVLSKKKKTR